MICAAGNIGAYYLLRKPVALHNQVQIENEMTRIEAEVRTLRGISDAAPVKRTLISPDQLRAEMTDEFQKIYTRASRCRTIWRNMQPSACSIQSSICILFI